MPEPIWNTVFLNDSELWLGTNGLREGAGAAESGCTWLWRKKQQGRTTSTQFIHSWSLTSKCTNLNSFEVRQVLLNLATQLGRCLEDGVVVLHHEGHQFGGKQLIQVHLIYWAQNTVGKHLHHLDTVHKEIDEKITRTIRTIYQYKIWCKRAAYSLFFRISLTLLGRVFCLCNERSLS